MTTRQSAPQCVPETRVSPLKAVVCIAQSHYQAHPSCVSIHCFLFCLSRPSVSPLRLWISLAWVSAPHKPPQRLMSLEIKPAEGLSLPSPGCCTPMGQHTPSSAGDLPVRTSCNYCRLKKIKCDKVSPEHGGCSRCRREKLACCYGKSVAG